MITGLSKGLPRALRAVAADAAEHGSFRASTNLYVYNKVNSHLAGRAGQGGPFVGSNEVNRRLLRPNRRDASMSGVYRQNASAYQKARAKRMTERGMADIERYLSGGAK